MQATTAEDQFLDDGDAQAELFGANRRHVAAGATTEQDEIELMSGCRNFRHRLAGLLVINAGAQACRPPGISPAASFRKYTAVG